jgi:Polymerase beta, Nucleotidyltransferase
VSISTLTTQRKVSKGLQIKLDAILKHIVKILNPEIVFLIGSMQRGIIHDNSDLDLVVLINGSYHRKNLLLDVLPSRPHKDIPLDLHVYDRNQFDEMKTVGGLCFEAYNHGRIVYAKESI